MARQNLVRIALCGFACVAMTATGCVSYKSNGTEKILWRSSRKAPKTETAVKDPTTLNLAYARWQEQVGQLVEAREYYELALSNDPTSADAVLGIARLDYLADRKQKAEVGYQKALRLAPDDAHTLAAVGQFYASEERWDESISALEAAMVAEPDDNSYRYQLAVAMARAGKIDGAMPHFVRTVGDAVAHYNVGYILYEEGDLQRAADHFQQAVLKQPSLNQAQVMLSEIRSSGSQETILAGNSQSADAHQFDTRQAASFQRVNSQQAGAQPARVQQAGGNAFQAPVATYQATAWKALPNEPSQDQSPVSSTRATSPGASAPASAAIPRWAANQPIDAGATGDGALSPAQREQMRNQLR